MTKINLKRDWKKILGVILIAATAIGILSVFISFDKETTEQIPTSAFEVGSIDTKTGEYIEGVEDSFYTKDAFGCQGLRVAPDFEFSGTYDVFYYDYNEHFLEAKLGLKGVYDEDYPLAKLARVVFHPTVPEDESADGFEISWWELHSYAKLANITVNKNQEWIYDTINLYIEEDATKGMTFAIDADGKNQMHPGQTYLPLTESSTTKVSNKILVNGELEKYDIFVKKTDSNVSSTFSVVATVNGLVVANAYADLSDYAVGDWVKVTIEVPEDKEAEHLRVRLPIDSDCYVFGYND